MSMVISWSEGPGSKILAGRGQAGRIKRPDPEVPERAPSAQVHRQYKGNSLPPTTRPAGWGEGCAASSSTCYSGPRCSSTPGGQAVGGDHRGVAGNRRARAGRRPAAVNEHLAPRCPVIAPFFTLDDVEALAQPARTLPAPLGVAPSDPVIKFELLFELRYVESVPRNMIWQPSLLDGMTVELDRSFRGTAPSPPLRRRLDEARARLVRGADALFAELLRETPSSGTRCGCTTGCCQKRLTYRWQIDRGPRAAVDAAGHGAKLIVIGTA